MGKRSEGIWIGKVEKEEEEKKKMRLWCAIVHN